MLDDVEWSLFQNKISSFSNAKVWIFHVGWVWWGVSSNICKFLSISNVQTFKSYFKFPFRMFTYYDFIEKNLLLWKGGRAKKGLQYEVKMNDSCDHQSYSFDGVKSNGKSCWVWIQNLPHPCETSLNPSLSSTLSSLIILLKYPFRFLLFTHSLVFPQGGFLIVWINEFI